jgi:transcription antitermination factor NusG
MAEGNWYAVRTIPGSQKPQREFVTEKTNSRKGYRLVPSLNPNYSAIELALSKSGFTYYMPAEKRLVRDRRKTDLFKTRRFALMVGYIFVRDPHSFYALQEVPGVHSVVGIEGRPMPISIVDILDLRGMEAEAEVEFDAQVKKARWTLRKKAKRDEKLRALVDSLDLAGTFTIPLDSDVLAA